MADPWDHGQAEPGDITTALDVEQLDLNLYRSRHLSLPYQARGVFGGQVISQALVAATKCVKPEFALHSLHAYFLHGASASAPLLYYVDNVRDGRSYCTRSVRAVQAGRNVFVMLCSFQIPEFWQPSRQWTMPQAPHPDKCKSEVEYLKQMAARPGVSEEGRSKYLAYVKSKEESPISVKYAGDFVNELEGRRTFMYWMKTKNNGQYSAAFQKCMLAYMSDLNFIPVAAITSQLKRSNPNGPSGLAMMLSLDHSVMFYRNDFDCGDWMLYVITSPTAALGRAVCTGLLYTQGGTLLAVVNQEGVLRAKVYPPNEEAKAKM